MPIERAASFAAAAILSVFLGAALAESQTSAAQPSPQTPPALQGRAPGASTGIDAYGELTDPGLQSRFEHITAQLRCLVCQNESIADSNAELASDLRGQVREMLVAGQSDAAIFQFMTDRYGEFVRFNPPLEPKTLLIWGAPFIALLIAGWIIFRVARQRARMPVDDEPAPGPM
jgi:cytochrome c-type biogenesis protein CcmH